MELSNGNGGNPLIIALLVSDRSISCRVPLLNQSGRMAALCCLKLHTHSTDKKIDLDPNCKRGMLTAVEGQKFDIVTVHDRSIVKVIKHISEAERRAVLPWAQQSVALMPFSGKSTAMQQARSVFGSEPHLKFDKDFIKDAAVFGDVPLE